jgi:four helix bundle protein
MGDHTQLQTWKKAHVLSLEVYRATRHFPVEERFGLTAQLRRVVIPVESNIAEGSGRKNDKVLCRFLSIARRSIKEVACQLLIARDLAILEAKTWFKLDKEAQEISRMLNRLIDSLRHPITPFR